ncbi:heme o synthase [Serinibacter arcticus]|uniref:Protoheme IX farnesyltransferase n=1 Tax=Serinibacter arcticus TaxID=1655435 RepID=A0A4Z1DYC0_9MICO|nr:heme o synthase [Serinibacter arcticus]TGO04584.1 Heme O synthase, protoheme IX farnesyltransferase [Serinibacter arcticus]
MASTDSRPGRLVTPSTPQADAVPGGSSETSATAPKPAPERSGWRRTLGAYVSLTKPRVIELLLVTTVPTMILAQRGLPPIWLILATLVGGAAAAGSANVLNCYIDRDIDAVMGRTKRRPLVTGEVTPRQALVFGTVLGVASIAWFALVVNVAAALLTLGAILIYVVGYTMILKRRTSQNIVWGGAAGCMPVLIGWSAVTGGLEWAALILFGIIFLWTPPHYWPLSMRFKDDYAAAGVPMLPVVAGERRVAGEMVAYAVAMVLCSLALIPVAGMGWAYIVAASVAGIWFTASCVRLYRIAIDPERRGVASRGPAMKVFHGSITYLTIVFAAVAVDPFLPW